MASPERLTRMKVALSDTQSKASSLLWDPSKNGVETSVLADFVRFIEARGAGPFGGFDHAAFLKLQGWAVKEPEKFWDAVWDFSGVIGDKGSKVIEKTKNVPWARFFPDSKISYAENLLHRVHKKPDDPAIIARTQNGPDRVLTWEDLCHEVSIWQQAFEKAGVVEGDRVAVYLPNIPEAIIILLAASNIGAVFASAGMEMGQSDLVNRFKQVKPKILVTTEGYVHGEKTVDRKKVIEHVRAEISSLEKIVVLTEGDHEFTAGIEPQPLEFKRRGFNHPLYILFSSGSTGKPKCFEHSTGGVMLKHISEYLLHCDIRAGDRVFYHATPSWMMWNWLAGSLSTGATILLYDGSPAYPDAYAQWEFTTSNGCTHHGSAAPVILSWEQAKIIPRERYDLSGLRMVMSTGAVLPKQGFEFIHSAVKQNVKIGSISGGTDIVGCFLGGNMFTPTYAGQINGPMLGCDVQVWDEDGKVLGAGEAGELVCANAFPSMPLRFVDDEQGERYAAEYFEYFKDLGPGKHVWRHGDSIERTAQGQFVIIGRSDATLNQNGVRIGTVAIYDQLKPFADKIKDAAAIDFTRPDNKQTITVLFLALPDGSNDVPEDLKAGIKKAVKDNITPYAIPTEIIAVPGTLKTPNGKIAEVVMKKIVSGKSIPNASLYGEELVKNFEKIGEELNKKYGG